jgi:predicted aminopeptidase
MLTESSPGAGQAREHDGGRLRAPRFTSRRPLRPTQTLRLLCVVGALLLSGCSTISYLAQAAHGQWQLMHARRPIERVIADPTTSATLKTRLALVEDIRSFAVTDLGLPDNSSYRSYSDLGRPYAVWNVVAAPSLSVRPRHWCFPITGCIDYRGYFHEREARHFAAGLAARGDDVMVEGVTAYSTLGHFADPVLNTMLRYDDLELAGVIFHELAHQLIYVRGDSEFNESFAVTVETEGLARWLRARGRAGEIQLYSEQRQIEQAINEVFAAARAQLKAMYASDLTSEQKRRHKQQILAQAGREVLAIEQRAHMHSEYDAWIRSGLNNAHLVAVGTYFDCVDGFEQLLRQQQGDMQQFYAAVRRIAGDPASRRSLCHADAATTAAKATGSPPPDALD